MRKILFLISIAFIWMTSCQEKKVKIKIGEQDFQTIQSVLNMQVQSWNNGDIDGFMKGYWHSDSLRFISKNGIRRSYDSVSNKYKNHYDSEEKMGHLSFLEIEYNSLSEFDSIVNVTGKWSIASKDSSHGFFSLILKPIHSKWRIITDHTW